MKLKCINDAGMAGLLTYQKLYDGAPALAGGAKGYKIVSDKGAGLWCVENRFHVVQIVRIKCIDNLEFNSTKPASSQANGMKFDLVQGATYDGILLNDSGYELVIPSLSITWRPYFRKERFAVVDNDGVPDTLRTPATAPATKVDKEIEKQWDFFAKPVADAHTCGSCGMPKPCKYHLPTAPAAAPPKPKPDYIY